MLESSRSGRRGIRAPIGADRLSAIAMPPRRRRSRWRAAGNRTCGYGDPQRRSGAIYCAGAEGANAREISMRKRLERDTESAWDFGLWHDAATRTKQDRMPHPRLPIPCIGVFDDYGSGGLGVPLVALWPGERDGRARAPEDRYFPEDVATPATAVLQVGEPGNGGAWRGRSLSLILHDPFAERATLAAGKSWPLASDRTTPLAVQVNRGRGLRTAAVLVFLPQILGGSRRAFTFCAISTRKIPVVLVHGLLSSPLSWAETYNELCNDPVLAERYQFWMFLYATGEPIPVAGKRAFAGRLARGYQHFRSVRDGSLPSTNGDRRAQPGRPAHQNPCAGIGAKRLGRGCERSLSGVAASPLIAGPFGASVNLPPGTVRTQSRIHRDAAWRQSSRCRTAWPVRRRPLATPGNAARIGDELDAAYGPGSYNGGLRGETFSLRASTPRAESSKRCNAFRSTGMCPTTRSCFS